MPDHGRTPVPERDEQVAHAAGVRPERVVPARLVRPPVPEQVGRDDRVALGEQRNHLVPLLRAPHDAVDQQYDRTAVAGGAVADPVAVKDDLVLRGP